MGKSYDEIQKLFDKEMKRVNTFVAMSSEAQESNEKKVEGSEEKAKSSRKKSLETDKHEEVEADDTAELKKHLVIKKDDDIAIDVIPLATKPPVIRRFADSLEVSQNKACDLRPKDEHERVLWGDLKVMFEPDIRSDVWRNLQGYKTYKQLYDSIKPARIRSKEQCDDLINQVNIKSVEISDLNSRLQEKVLVITALKNDLRKLKGKDLADNAVTKHTIVLEMLKINVEYLNPRLLNNRPVHSNYIKHTQEEAATLREIVEQGK
ncbi:hypothetical protein Tco_0337172 [Tanacetum coccineum]